MSIYVVMNLTGNNYDHRKQWLESRIRFLSYGNYRTSLTLISAALSLFFIAAYSLANGSSLADSLVLSDKSVRYDINSDSRTSGLFVCPKDLPLSTLRKKVQTTTLAFETTTLPNFKKNNRYCFYSFINNYTSASNWVLHFSNFYIDKVRFIVYSQNGEKEYYSELHNGVKRELINVLGRGFPVQLKKSETYFIAVELTADGFVAPPYIGLMSEPVYKDWSSDMELVYYTSIGIIFGLIVVALICGIILKDITFLWFGISSALLLFFFAIRSHFSIYIYFGSQNFSPWLWSIAMATVISVLLFSRSFLLSGSGRTLLAYSFNAAIGISLVVFILGLLLPKNVKIILLCLNMLYMMLLIFYAGVVKIREQGRYYLLFMLGWLPVLYSFLELIAIVVIEPAQGVSTLSYKVNREIFIQIFHMLVHLVAMLIRIMDLKKEKYQAELQNEAKSRFLASVSHDLRQPLHSMGMFLAHLNEHVNSKAGQVILAKVFSLHSSMNDSFKTIMDLSRLEAGAVKLNMEAVDLARMMARMRLEFEPYAHEKGLKLTFKCVATTVYSDPVVLERIIRNLISNAIKYAEKGGVLVGFRYRNKQLLLQVWDTGPGIKRADMQVIFDIYKRSESVLKNQSGMGIGLSIVQHLVDLLGGEISVRSNPNRGSVFQVFLPADDEPLTELKDKKSKQDKPGVRIIMDLSDSVLLNQVSENLGKWGYLTEVKGESISNGVSPITLFITDTQVPFAHSAILTEFRETAKQFKNVVMVIFQDNIDRILADKLAATNVYILSRKYRPAQLRSLIRYLEGFLIDK